MAKGHYIPAALLLIIPTVVVLLVPLYNKVNPEYFGLPFFWFFIGIMLVVAAIMYVIAAAILEKYDTDEDKGDA